LFEEMTKALLGWVFKPNAAGVIETQVDVLLLTILILAFAALYKFHLRPLFKLLDKTLPNWEDRAQNIDSMVDSHKDVMVYLKSLSTVIGNLGVEHLATQDSLKSMKTQLLLSEQSLLSVTKDLHTGTERNLLEWLERAEDRTADQLRELSVIQSEIRNLSTLLMATTVSRFNKPLG
jgi:hypothetical protein